MDVFNIVNGQIQQSDTNRNKLPKEQRPTLEITFYLQNKVNQRIESKSFDNAVHASDSLSQAMASPNSSIALAGKLAGRQTMLIVNLQEVAFITIDGVPSEGDAE